MLDGEVLEDADQILPPNRRRIGYVPQEGSLFPHLTVAANVGFGLDRAERRGSRVSELLEMVGLSGYEHRFPHELSGGQQQRVALARALAISPSLVLLDEPFSSLDATLRQSVRLDVRRVLADAGTTVILVTHDQDEALSLSDEGRCHRARSHRPVRHAERSLYAAELAAHRRRPRGCQSPLGGWCAVRRSRRCLVDSD